MNLYMANHHWITSGDNVSQVHSIYNTGPSTDYGALRNAEQNVLRP